MQTINQLENDTILLRSTLRGRIPELKQENRIVKLRVYNISYANINLEEAKIDRMQNKNNYFVSALIELTDDKKVVHNVIAEDVYVIHNGGKVLVNFFDNYEYITPEIIFHEYKQAVKSFRKDNQGSKKMTQEYLSAYRKEISEGYRELFNFYKIRNKEFNQNTLENRRFMKIRKKLSRDILKELLISRIIIEYRSKNILT